MTRLRAANGAGRGHGRAERLATAVARFAGTSSAFLIAVGLVVAWVVSGPIFHFSATWQLFINSGTTIVTFLMVFLIQRNQSKDALALQLKLNEIVAALKGASNRLVSVEDLSEEELATLHAHYQRLADGARNEVDLLSSHSIEEAGAHHEAKLDPAPRPAPGEMDELGARGEPDPERPQEGDEEHRSEQSDQPARG